MIEQNAELTPEEVLVEVERGLRAFKAFQKAEKIITAVRDADARLKEIQASTDAALHNHADTLKKLEQEIADCETRYTTALRKAEAAEQDARIAGETTIQAAYAEAEKLTTSAKADAEAWNVEAEKAKAAHAETTALTEVKSKELAELEEKIVSAREQIQKILGG